MRRFLHHRFAPALLLIAASAGPLGFALFTQYVLKLPPCHYCILQRYPYLLPLLAGVIALTPFGRVHARNLLLAGILGWLITAGIGAFHVGVEEGWITVSGGCSAGLSSGGSLDDLRAQILGAPIVACNAIMVSFLGLSMAAWNVIAALGFSAIALYLRSRLSDGAHA